MNEEDYTSDSDQSDEDFCPEKLKHCDDSVSEEEDEDSEPLSDAEEKNVKKSSIQLKRKKKCIKRTKVNDDDSEEEKGDIENSKNTLATKRSSRVQTRTGSNLSQSACLEKDKLESDDEEKVRTDSLWSSFLSDVKPKNSENDKKTAPTRKRSEIIKKNVDTAVASVSSAKTPIFDMNVKAEAINKTNMKAEKSSAQQNEAKHSVDEDQPLSNVRIENACRTPIGIKRPAALGGLGSILGSIGKKKKESVLEKSKLDWKSYKQDEGLDEELQTHNKGKDGYLERMDFLQRTDLRQFEIEKKLRISRRAK